MRRELLAARDRRQAALERRRARSRVTLALNVPGPSKAPPGALALFELALWRLPWDLVERWCDVLGPFALLASGEDPVSVKRRAVALETRLVDLDVYGAAGPVGRAELGLPPRTCLLCARPAVECMRLGRHSTERLQEVVRALLPA